MTLCENCAPNGGIINPKPHVKKGAIFMKKLTRVLVSLALTLSLALGLTLTAHATPAHWAELNTPTSYDFEIQFTLDSSAFDELPAMATLVLGDNGIALHMAGSFVSDNAAAQFFTEITIGDGLLGDAPIRFWMDIDFNDMCAPTFVAVVELPVLLRTLLALTAPELSQQFLVLDLGEEIASAMADLPDLIDMVQAEMPSEEELAQIMADAMDVLAELQPMLARLFEVVHFVLDYSIEEGYFTGLSLELDVIISPNRDPLDIYLSLDVAISNINQTTVEMPAINSSNSLDLLELF